ncbi:MAG: RNA polymerase sigma factor [Gammaproteobacteria bacterium]
MTPDAKQLLEHYCRNGDRTAFNTFYRQQADRLWRYLRVRGCSEDSAYDLVSEAFLKFIQVVCKDLRAPLALLYRIAINLQIDDFRRRKVSPVDYDNDAVTTEPVVVEDNAGLQSYVRSLIKTLPETEQNLLLLRYWIGLTHKEIAISLDIPEGTIRRQCAEALQKLKHRWQEQDNE